MTAAAISLVDFVNAFVVSFDVCRDIHPSELAIVGRQMDAMRSAAEHERPDVVARYAKAIADRTAQERQWYEEDLAAMDEFRRHRHA